ncbi:uncharacterized protein AKAME5_001190700 [Lates japonicus]|uniref:Transmembrane protein n=1 Tax=Lates japonicus TaxID=270547 RepID=A0AAD3R9D7_LATJO|nr:uncharacterized protein AKAME5_001190700 [Lates japonicus]
MTVSSFFTARYLHRHMRRMAQTGSCFSAPRIQSQLRVTIAGISQGVLYFLYNTFYLFDSFTYFFSPHFVLSSWISFTVTTLYISGTTVNLCIGQAMFRQGAADVWRALKALCGVGVVTNDVILHSVKAHFFFCLCVMVMSSGSTVVYLCRHMGRMVANGQPLSCPRFRGQARVTVTGILQGVMHHIQPGNRSGSVQAKSSRHLDQSHSVQNTNSLNKEDDTGAQT